MLTKNAITRIVNPAVTVHFIMDTELPGHAVSNFLFCSQKVQAVVWSCDHTPGVAEPLPQLHPGPGPIPLADN